MKAASVTAPGKPDSVRAEAGWAELIQQMARGDQAALAEFYDQSSRLVFGLVLRIVKERGAAEEITLDTYHQVWRQAQSFDAARGKPSTWLLTIARSRAIDRLRASAWSRQEQTPLEEVTPFVATHDSPEKNAVLGERQRLVRAALSRLKAEQRVLIEAAFFGGLSHQELAEKLALPLGTVKTRIRTGMLKLRELLLAEQPQPLH